MKFFLFLCSLLLATGAAAQAREVPTSIPDENILNLDLSTGGRVVILLRPDIAPNHVERIRTLAGQGFYDGLIFHRVIPGFMAQGGDPTGTGQGGSDLPDLEPEFTKTPHLRGTVAMARAQAENSANSQFYITFMPRTQLDGNYTVFGRVFSGMEYVDAIAPGEPPQSPDRIVQARIGRDVSPPPPSLAQSQAPGAAKDVGELSTQLPAGIGLGSAANAPAAEGPGAAPAAPTVVDEDGADVSATAPGEAGEAGEAAAEPVEEPR